MTTTALQNEKNHSDYLVCKWCGKSFHYFKSHVANGNCEGIPESVKDADPDTVLKMYTTQFPDEPTLSKKALDAIQAKRAEQKSEMAKSSGLTSSPGYTGTVEYKTDLVAAHELLNVTVEELGTKRGTPLMVSVNVNTPYPEFVPEVKKGYVYGDFELIKDIFMMLELGIPGYLWGHAGTGKSSLPTQLCALLNRPLIRAQHTASMEEAHVTGQILARDGSTYFEPGLLALAMKHGWVYLADEYDLRFHRFLACISQCWKVKRWSSKRRLQNGVALLRMNGLLSLALATRTDLVMKPACTRVQTSRTPRTFRVLASFRM